MKYEITFILPCLNEEKTLEFCINEIKNYIRINNLNAEILLADNSSTDNSRQIAKKNNVRIVIEKKIGYGSTLINGINNAEGKYCIMGDCDGSYDFSHIDDFIKELRNGYDLVVGNRFKGGIDRQAMPFSHKIGGIFLSEVSNLFFHTKIHDYNCGLRAFNTKKIKLIGLKEEGMEFASEMIIKAKLNKLLLIEIPTVLRKDLRDSKSHIRPIRDGFRHLKLILKIALNKNRYREERE